MGEPQPVRLLRRRLLVSIASRSKETPASSFWSTSVIERISTDFDYDAISRLDSLVQDLSGSSNDQSLTFSYNPADQIASRTASYGFDADNRLTSASGGATFEYDALGRLYEADATGVAATRFLYDGTDLIAEYNTSGTLQRRFVHGPQTDEPLVWYEGSGTSDRRWLVTDERGSIIAVTDDAGDPIAINSYDEYGQPDANNVGRFQYTGQVWIEAAGLYYYKARFYAPAHGRFLQTDPVGYGAGLNLYAYVGHDPINLIDPTGTDETFTEIVVTAERNPATGSCGRSGELCALRAAAEAAAAALGEAYDAWQAEMAAGPSLGSGDNGDEAAQATATGPSEFGYAWSIEIPRQRQSHGNSSQPLIVAYSCSPSE